jgi:3-oxoacyl-[acyl-carrier protein] reductase
MAERDIALITGASGGIGQAIAHMLQRKSNGDLKIGLHYNNNLAAVQKLQKEIPNSFLVKADLSDSQACEILLNETKKQGTPYILINNAGISSPHEPALEIQRSSFEAMMNINFKTSLFLMQNFAKEMIRAGSGIIVNISSVLARHGLIGTAVYRATKAALEETTKQFAFELGNRGIRVNAVAPGFIETPMTASIPFERREPLLAKISSGKFGNPEAVADAVGYLIENDYINGAVLQVDGGLAL